jgi:hypothetical protein
MDVYIYKKIYIYIYIHIYVYVYVFIYTYRLLLPPLGQPVETGPGSAGWVEVFENNISYGFDVTRYTLFLCLNRCMYITCEWIYIYIYMYIYMGGSIRK